MMTEPHDETDALVELAVSQQPVDGVPVVSIHGDVDVYSAPNLRDSLNELFDNGSATVIVDLTDVAFLDSTGLGALIEARKSSVDAGGTLPVVCTHERILKLFTITGLD